MDGILAICVRTAAWGPVECSLVACVNRRLRDRVRSLWWARFRLEDLERYTRGVDDLGGRRQGRTGIYRTMAKREWGLTDEMMNRLECLEVNNPHYSKQSAYVYSRWDVRVLWLLARGPGWTKKVAGPKTGNSKKEKKEETLLRWMDKQQIVCSKDEEAWDVCMVPYLHGRGTLADVGMRWRRWQTGLPLREIRGIGVEREMGRRLWKAYVSGGVAEASWPAIIEALGEDPPIRYTVPGVWEVGMDPVDWIQKAKARERRYMELDVALKAVGLRNRTDSRLCQEYIDGTDGDSDDDVYWELYEEDEDEEEENQNRDSLTLYYVVNTMREMDFLYRYTSYASQVRDEMRQYRGGDRNRYIISGVVRDGMGLETDPRVAEDLREWIASGRPSEKKYEGEGALSKSRGESEREGERR